MAISHKKLACPYEYFNNIDDYKKPVDKLTRKWHSESADPAKALNLPLAKQTNKQTNKKFWPHRGSNSQP